MEKVIRISWNVATFVTDQKYQWEQPWVRQVADKCKILHQHIWTGMRVPLAFATIYLDYLFGNPWLTLLSMLLTVLTDWIDGKVVLAKGQVGTRFGSIFDGIVDRICMISWFYYFGIYKLGIIQPEFFWSLVFVETFSYILLGFLEWGNFIKDDSNFYEHLKIGKIKFGIQVALGIILWLAYSFSPEWFWWPLIVNLILGISLILAIFAVGCKIDKEFMKFFPDFISAGNLFSGIYSIILAKSNLKYACTLIVLGAAFDFFDGMMARKLRKVASSVGKIIDSVSDWVTFGIAPGYLVYQAGVSIWAVIFYWVATTSRLIYYSSRPGKEGVFDGFPSTAAAILIACLSFFYQGEYLTAFVICMGILEISFLFNWYHFKKFSKVSAKKRNGLLAVYGLGIIALGLPQSTFIFMLVYLALFFQPVADKIFFNE